MADYLTMHMAQLARLVDKLSAMPDVDGRSVMDNTLIVSGSELANGWHGYHTIALLFSEEIGISPQVVMCIGHMKRLAGF